MLDSAGRASFLKILRLSRKKRADLLLARRNLRKLKWRSGPKESDRRSLRKEGIGEESEGLTPLEGCLTVLTRLRKADLECRFV